jgi:hypothetical protein
MTKISKYRDAKRRHEQVLMPPFIRAALIRYRGEA